MCSGRLWPTNLRVYVIQDSCKNVFPLRVELKQEVSRSAGILGNILFLPGPSALLDQLSFHALDWLLH